MKKTHLSIKLLLTLICFFAVNTLKAQTAPVGSQAVYCSGEQIKMVTPAVTGAVSYVWYRYDGIGITGTKNTVTGQNTVNLVDATVLAPGFYTYTSAAANINGCMSSESSSVTIYVLPPVTASITSSYASNNICINVLPATGKLTAIPGTTGTVTFADTDFSYQWAKNGTDIAGETGITYTLTAGDILNATTTADSYTVKINYISHPCPPSTTSAPYNVNIIALPAAPSITIVP